MKALRKPLVRENPVKHETQYGNVRYSSKSEITGKLKSLWPHLAAKTIVFLLTRSHIQRSLFFKI